MFALGGAKVAVPGFDLRGVDFVNGEEGG